MNLQLLSTDIVRRVQHSPDSAHNLAQVVAGLIEQEMERDRLVNLGRAIEETKSLLADYAKDFSPK